MNPSSRQGMKHGQEQLQMLETNMMRCRPTRQMTMLSLKKVTLLQRPEYHGLGNEELLYMFVYKYLDIVN